MRRSLLTLAAVAAAIAFFVFLALTSMSSMETHEMPDGMTMQGESMGQPEDER